MISKSLLCTHQKVCKPGALKPKARMRLNTVTRRLLQWEGSASQWLGIELNSRLKLVLSAQETFRAGLHLLCPFNSTKEETFLPSGDTDPLENSVSLNNLNRKFNSCLSQVSEQLAWNYSVGISGFCAVIWRGRSPGSQEGRHWSLSSQWWTPGTQGWSLFIW